MILELAGIAGVAPWEFTLRELAAIADGRRRDAWQRHSVLLALTWNANQTDKAKCKTADDFDPYEQRQQRRRITAKNIHLLKVLTELPHGSR